MESYCKALFTGAAVLFLCATGISAQPESLTDRLVVEGTVFDFDSRLPIPFATVRVEGTGRSTLANGEGQYRLVLGSGERNLKFSHIAYYSEKHLATLSDTLSDLDICLHSSAVEIEGISVYTRAYDPGQRIIVEAIKRKEDILGRIHDYSYDAYTKVLATDETNPDSTEILMIAESQTTAYWEQPGKYKEVITSRRQSANIPAEGNLVTVGEILNFNKNRIDIGQYSIVTPTAEDALDHYNYYLLDTIFVDSQAVFKLEIEPINPADPLFVGYIHIADSTYDVIRVDVGFSPGVEFPMVSELSYSQRFAQFQDEYWMPIDIRFSAVVEIHFPTIPDRIGLSHTASLYDYHIETGIPEKTFGEAIIEVVEEADDYDSLAWQARQTIPLTDFEVHEYQRIDSVENEPPSVGKIALTAVAAAVALTAFGDDDIFRYNRVEGPYVGLGAEIEEPIRNFDLRLQSGYAFEAERWEHKYGLTYHLDRAKRMEVGFDYLNRVVKRPTVISGPGRSFNFWSLFANIDPMDYYRAEGFRVFASTKLVDHTGLSLAYSDFQQFSMPALTDYSFFGEDTLHVNPAIHDGKLRSVEAEFTFDSRKMFKNKRRFRRISSTQYSLCKVGVEYASPDFIENDFDFRRYWVSLRRSQRTLGLGVTSLYLYAGASDGDLPPQKYFAVDFGQQYLSEAGDFLTFDENNFSGNRVLAFRGQHEFRRRLWTAGDLPLVRDIPFWLSLHGGVCWTEFKNHTFLDDDAQVNTADKPYSEIGFGLGNLTPFIAPFNFAVFFTWQLSDYDTSDFNFAVGFQL
ncbi:MAG: carboxypeptidase-like regulatory domain-containing protein [bacterium]|nr:carboxypeptidase-like regulatory domain-containing protein [bacterium]